ncbi:hypothetical protein DVH05_011881 [Phytophthora capsici]|nr:hypothetical protein DVH05_011881 [Phytophthora capsici]
MSKAKIFLRRRIYLDRCDLGKVSCWQETPPFSTDFVYIPAELKKQKSQDREAYTDAIIAMNHASNGSDGSGICPEDNSNSAAITSAAPGANTITDELGPEVCLESSRSSSPTLIATPAHVTNDEEEAPSPSSNRSDTRDGSSAVAFSRRNLHASFEAEAGSESKYEQSQSDDRKSIERSRGNEREYCCDYYLIRDTYFIMYDPNIVKPGKHLEDYAVLDSDGENEGHSVYDDDDDIGPIDPAAEDAAVASDLHFNPALLDVVGRVAELARGNVHKTCLQT